MPCLKLHRLYRINISLHSCIVTSTKISTKANTLSSIKIYVGGHCCHSDSKPHKLHIGFNSTASDREAIECRKRLRSTGRLG